MKYLVLIALLLCAGCTPTAPRRVDIELHNDLEIPIIIRAHAGILSRDICLDPQETWRGWIPMVFFPKKIRIVVKK